MMQKNKLALIIPALLMFLAPGFAATSDDELAKAENNSGTERGEEVLITLQIPLGSPLFSETPVAVVDEEPITLYDLTRQIMSMHQTMEKGSTSTKKDYADLLERVITARLIVHEARNIGLDELSEVSDNIETKSTEILLSMLMAQELADVEPDPAEVTELYEKMSREYLLSTVTFQDEADAHSFKEQVDAGEDFDAVAKSFGEDGRAESDAGGEKYVKLKDLLPRIAQAAIDMKAGSVSEVFAGSEGFFVFRVGEMRFYEDSALKDEAFQKALEPAMRKAARKYVQYLEEQHSTVDERLLKQVDFESKKVGFLFLGKEEPVDFDELEKDERVVATVHVDPPFIVTVGDLASGVRKAFFHGVETATDRKKELNKQKWIVLENLLFKRTAVVEARFLGLDQTDAYFDAMDDFTTSLLFDVFVRKVIAPDVKISEDEVREYFEAHIEDYSSPKMFRLNSIAFNELPDAESALGKLNKRADFKWVSANSPGRVDEENEEIFDFDGALLTETALPEDLRGSVEDAKRGDAMIYSDDKGYHHVLVIDRVFPSTPQSYESVRGPAAKAIFEQKLKILVDDWSEKLKEAYETRIFVEKLGD